MVCLRRRLKIGLAQEEDKKSLTVRRDKGNDSDDNSDAGHGNGDPELPSLESVFSDGSETSLKRGEAIAKIRSG